MRVASLCRSPRRPGRRQICPSLRRTENIDILSRVILLFRRLVVKAIHRGAVNSIRVVVRGLARRLLWVQGEVLALQGLHEVLGRIPLDGSVRPTHPCPWHLSASSLFLASAPPAALHGASTEAAQMNRRLGGGCRAVKKQRLTSLRLSGQGLRMQIPSRSGAA